MAGDSSGDSKVCYSFYSFKPGDEFERSDFTDMRKQTSI